MLRAAAAMLVVGSAAAAASDTDQAADGTGTVQFHIEAQDLGSALNEFALQSGKEILFVEDEIAGKSTSEVSGSYHPTAALEQLLANTGLGYRINDLDTILVGNEIRVTTGEDADGSGPGSRNVMQRVAAGVASVLLGNRESSDETLGTSSGKIEEIVVVGIRASLRQSLDRKRNADHFMDAITAEDIGAFPAQNLAESLQRVSGVAIDRKSGEGAFVSVRGLGPQFVQTTIGGRVAASNVAPGSHDGRGATNTKSRAVGFHAFQTGLVQAVEVHKSPRADHVEGGLGGFVDIQPHKPFDLGKRHVVLAMDATINELAGDTAPGVFALVSDVLSDSLGLMVSAQWDNRNFRTDSFHQYGFLGDPRTVTIDGVEVGSGYYPSQLLGELHLTDRDRLNVSSSLQFQPSDRVDLTFEVLFTSNSSDEVDFWRSFRIAQGHPWITGTTLADDNGTGIFTMISTDGGGAFMQHATEAVDNEAVTYGANLRFQAAEGLSVDLDLTVSDTEAPITNRDALMRNTRTQMTYHKNGSGKLPSLSSTSPLTDVNHWSVVKQSIQKHRVDDRITQFRADATYAVDGDWLDTVQVGVRTYRQSRRDRARYLNSRAFIDQPISDFGGSSPFPAESDFLSALGIDFPSPVLNPNFDALQETFVTRADDIRAGAGFNTGTGKSLDEFASGRFNEDLNHDDDGNAIYAMLTFSGEFGTTPYSGNFGVRYVDNSTGSVGEITRPVDIDYSDPSSPEVLLSEPEYVNVGHDYTEVLPSLNLRFDPNDEVVVRASVAKVLSRPRYLDLNPRLTVQARPRTMRGGNGQLDPTTAVQFDLALEWYFADYSIASVGVFTKDIEAFVQPDIVPTPFPGVIDPETGNPLVLTAFIPLNTGKSSMTGIELVFQRAFADLLPVPFDGLGVVANYTYIDSGSDFANEKTGASYSIPGLSESTVNFTLFYEKGPLSARVSYNFRDDFLDDIQGGFSGHPYFVEAYEQFDASLNYSPTEKLSFSLEAINLADENVYYYNLLGTGTDKHYSSAINAGRRFQCGVRLKI
ncbi:MAG: TonB-dependent receptor [Gammaproteobacteria bacterium]|nr:TonB-dependent receptor [Gammaproteobacteria bacterium]